MTTVVYLGDRIIADTRASIRQKGFVGVKGDTDLLNDRMTKLETFGPGFFWDSCRQIQLMGAAGTKSGMKAFGEFMRRLQCPLEQFLDSFSGSEEMIYKIIGLSTPSTFLLCLETGDCVKLFINERIFHKSPVNRKVKACGSGSFYFDASKHIFQTDPVLLFRMASTVDPSSSDGSYIEALYNEEKREWVLDREIKHFDTPVDPEVLINSLHPNIRAMFKGTVSEVSEIPDDKLPIDPPEQVPVKIPTKKGAKCKT